MIEFLLGGESVDISKRSYWLTEFLLLTVAIIWGMNYTMGKFGVVQLQPVMFNAIRFGIAAPILLLIAYLMERSLRIKWRDVGRLVAVSLIGVTIYQSLFMTAVKYGSAANTSLLIAMSPLFTSLFAVLFKLEKMTWRVQIGSIIAFLGAAIVLLFSHHASVGSEHHRFMGDVIGLIASLFWGLYPVVTAPLLTKYSALRITAWSAVLGMIPLMFLSGGIDVALLLHLTSSTWISLLFSSIFVTAYGLVIWYVGVGKVGASKVMVYMYLIPLIAVIFAALVIHEALYVSQIIGGIVILFGIAYGKGVFHHG